MAQVSAIFLHPIKALDAVAVEAATVLASGALAHDRRWALFDARGRFVNGKNRAAIHAIRAQYELTRFEVSLEGKVFSLVRQSEELAAHLSDRLEEPIRVAENPDVGFPDDLDSPGPTCVSRASLAEVARWFGFSLDEARARFRTNIEVDGVEPFWEDQLYQANLRAGAVELSVVNPCQRCVVPSRHPTTGDVTPMFQKRFVEWREAGFPGTGRREPFNHYYRFAVNTKLAPDQAGKTLRLGDEVRFPYAP
jgi:uncharacterized protein YcbX